MGCLSHAGSGTAYASHKHEVILINQASRILQLNLLTIVIADEGRRSGSCNRQIN